MNQKNSLADLLQALMALLAVMMLMWEETPVWQRELIRQRTRQVSRKLMDRFAIRSGELAMSDELHGHPRIAEWRYRFTRRLSELRDRL